MESAMESHTTNSDTAEHAAVGHTAPDTASAPEPQKTSEKKVAKRQGKLAKNSKQVSKKAKKSELEVGGLESVLKILDAQDEDLKTWKNQAQDMLRTNANLRKAIKQTVKEASKHDELNAELASYKRKWANLQNLLS